jgi:hypothetical protein
MPVSEPPDSLYPPGYRDPDWDGTEEGFRNVVLPARVKALTEGINERYAGVLPEGMRFEFVSSEDET